MLLPQIVFKYLKIFVESNHGRWTVPTVRYGNVQPISRISRTFFGGSFQCRLKVRVGQYILDSTFGYFLTNVIMRALFSTVSTGVNSLAAIWIHHLRRVTFTNEMWEKRSGIIAKMLSFCFGVLSFLLVFLVPYLGGLTPVRVFVYYRLVYNGNYFFYQNRIAEVLMEKFRKNATFPLLLDVLVGT